jgi:hypothetical protein
MLSQAIRSLAVCSLIVVGSTRASAQTLTPLYQYRYGDLEDFIYSTQYFSPDPGWDYLGATISVYDSQETGTIPLYRWYISSYGRHIFTTDYVSDPDFDYEGIVGYIWPSQQSGTQAIWRWYKWVSGGPVHFFAFTMSNQEAEEWIENGWWPEGIIGYAPACSSSCY